MRMLELTSFKRKTKFMLNKFFNFFRQQPQIVEPTYSSEWEKRFNTGPWNVDFVCPHCDFVMHNTEDLWKNRTSRNGLKFNHKCNSCKEPFEIEISVVTLFKTSYHNYLPTTVKSGFQLIKGGKEE